MATRTPIQRRLSEPDAVERVVQLMGASAGMHRTGLADRLCGEYGFIDAGGGLRRSGCLKALRTLEARGHFVLPAPRTKTGPARPRRLEHSVPAPQGVPHSVEQIRGLELVVVESEEQMRTWNEVFMREHPRGAGPLVGRQLRYLIGSEHGWLGGLGFASAALKLGARDRWIGWDMEARRAHLDRVVGLSRFLVRPSVECRNLASRVLGLAMRRLAGDFQARYGYRPWLVETFIDTSHYVGTCFKAANWIRVGTTQGRGRQDQGRKSPETVKDIHLYPLVDDFRQRMGLPEHSGLGPLPLDAGLESEVWADNEFGGAPLGDRRWSQRLVRSAKMQAEDPMRAFSGVARGNWAAVKGYYRFIDQPDHSGLTMDAILAPHRERTVRRMKAQETVLCIQDGTKLNYNDLADCEGLGVIGTNQTGAQSLGLKLHSTLAVTTDGLPLGVLRTQCWAPTGRSKEDPRRAEEIPIEEKDTYCWIQGLRDCRSVAADMPHTRVVSVMDREADFFELFDEWRQDPSLDLLVRAQSDAERRAAEQTVVAAAGKISREDRRAVAVLAALTAAEDLAVRGSLLQVLGEIGDRSALPVLRASLADGNVEVQTAAIRALSVWPTTEPLPDLREIAKASGHTVHQVLALRGYVHLLSLESERSDEEAVGLYREALALAPNDSERRMVLSGLANRQAIGALELAVEYLDDGTLQQEAEVAVARIARGTYEDHPARTRDGLNKLIRVTQNEQLRNRMQDFLDSMD